MKKIFLFIFLTQLGVFGFSQKGNTFKFTLNSKELVKDAMLPEENPIETKIKKALVKEKNNISIIIKEKSPQKDWHRVFIINNDQDQEIAREVSKLSTGTFNFDFVIPKTIKTTKLKIQTLKEPNDRTLAATIRLRTFPLVNITMN